MARREVAWGGCIGLVLSIAASGLASPLPDGELLVAVKQGDATTVRTLLREGAAIDALEGDGSTPLFWAIQRDDIDVARLLIAAGANVNAANRWGVTPLSLACINGSGEATEALLKAGANVEVAQRSGETSLMTASRTGNVAVVSLLLGAGADPSRKMPVHGQTALMWAASERHTDVVRRLIATGADVDARSNTGYTALMFAARAGAVDSTRLLKDAGGDVNAAAKDGFTALLLATVRGHIDTATFLLDSGANPNADGPGYTALHWAAGSWWTRLTGIGGIRIDHHPEWRAAVGLPASKVEFVNTLLKHGANPNARVKKGPEAMGGFAGGDSPPSMEGATAFWLAAYAADVAVMRALAGGGSDPTLATARNITPLMAAAGVGRVLGVARITEENALDATVLALSLGADVNATTNTGDTALHGAAACRSTFVLRYLLEKGAQLNAKNKQGFTPTDEAELTKQGGGGLIKQRSSVGDLLRSLGGVEGAPQHVFKRLR